MDKAYQQFLRFRKATFITILFNLNWQSTLQNSQQNTAYLDIDFVRIGCKYKFCKYDVNKFIIGFERAISL